MHLVLVNQPNVTVGTRLYQAGQTAFVEDPLYDELVRTQRFTEGVLTDGGEVDETDTKAIEDMVNGLLDNFAAQVAGTAADAKAAADAANETAAQAAAAANGANQTAASASSAALNAAGIADTAQSIATATKSNVDDLMVSRDDFLSAVQSSQEDRAGLHDDVAALQSSLASIQLTPGPAGAPSTVPGPPGADSTVPGPAGASAYALWLSEGNEGTLEDFLKSLEGPPGADGAPSTVPGPKGDTSMVPGPPGPTPSIGVSANALPSTSAPTVAVSGTAEDPILTFGIPAGTPGAPGAPGADSTVPGPPGPAPAFTASASALSAGATPTVNVSGTSPSLSLAFGIPVGHDGAAGTNGANAQSTVTRDGYTTTPLIGLGLTSAEMTIVWQRNGVATPMPSASYDIHWIFGTLLGSFTMPPTIVSQTAAQVVFTVKAKAGISVSLGQYLQAIATSL